MALGILDGQTRDAVTASYAVPDLETAVQQGKQNAAGCLWFDAFNVGFHGQRCTTASTRMPRRSDCQSTSSTRRSQQLTMVSKPCSGSGTQWSVDC